MNPDLQAKLVTYLDGLEKGAAKVGEFAEREIPETIREWLLWLAIENFVHGGLLLLAGVVFAILARKVVKAIGGMKNCGPHGCEPPQAAAIILLSALAAMATMGSVPFIMHGVKVLVAPRVVIVEKVAELAKGGAK